MPRGTQERALKVRDAQERLTNERGHAPTVGQLAEYLELSTEEVLDALQALQAYETVSLDASPQGRDDDVMTLGDAIGQEDERYELIELDQRWRQRSCTCRRASASSCGCVSSRISPRQRSRLASGSHRCRSRACCGGRSISCER